jgi:lysozyme
MRLNAKQWARVTAMAATGVAVGLGTFLSYHESGGKEYLTPYKDSGGVWTVCDGVTGKDVVPTKKYTSEECKALNAKHQAWAIACVEKYLPMVTEVDEKIGWASVCYNIGEANFANASFTKLRREGRRVQACVSVAQNWHKGGGVPHLLDDRRRDEVVLICGNTES